MTARAWLTGYYIVEYEQHGADRAKYGEGLLKKLAARLHSDNFALPSLKNYRAFYKVYPEVGLDVAAYLRERFGKGYTACSLLVDAPNGRGQTPQSPCKMPRCASRPLQCSHSASHLPRVWYNMLRKRANKKRVRIVRGRKRIRQDCRTAEEIKARI